MDMLHEMDNDERCLQKIVLLTDKVTFHACGHGISMYCHNIQIWAAENPCAYIAYESNIPKVNMWYGQILD